MRYIVKYLFLFLTIFGFQTELFSQPINIDASKLLATVEVYVSPRTGSFIEGSTFEVPIIINTKKSNINSIDVKVNFDPDILSIVNPSNGKSIVGMWVEPPKYDNTRGLVSYVGVIPNGIITESGLIGTITFKAIKSGRVTISISQNSSILLNDGLGSDAVVDFGRAEYSIIPKPPEGVIIFSETHPFQTDWYNNNSPIISWQKDIGVSGFSFELDNKPSTIPDNTVDTDETTKNFNSLNDGLWYFHIKAIKNGVWGSTGHFLVRIDTVPPADFKPEVDYVLATVVFIERTLISFFTTDNLSGVDHYEVGVIDKNQPITESPIFVESSSPFQVPLTTSSNLKVVVRAYDKAGNIKDSSIDVKQKFCYGCFKNKWTLYVIILILLVALFTLIIHYIVGHHIMKKVRKIFKIIEKD